MASTVVLACVPAGHGREALAPSAHTYPYRHSPHSTLPLFEAKEPLGHSLHVPVPFLAENEPGAHGLQPATSALPGMGLPVPAGHARHDALLDAPAPWLYVPGGHGRKT